MEYVILYNIQTIVIMKKVLFIVFVFVSFSGFAQAEKDSLVKVDEKAIRDKLELMFYLDRATVNYWKMSKQEKEESDKTFPYYFINTIVRNNPSSIDLAEFIGFNFKEFRPIKWKNFCDAVYQKNLYEFISLTEKYGYLSIKRLDRLKDKKADGQAVFVFRNDSEDKKIKKLLKKENKNGNLPDKEYDMFKLFLERKKIITAKDVARFEESGGKIIKESGPILCQ